MDVRTCRICRKLFNAIHNEKTCPACTQIANEKFSEVKEYIWANKGVRISDVVEHFDDKYITEQQIRQWIREERLEFDTAAGGIVCESCGTPISTGQYCEKCKLKLKNDFSSMTFAEKKQLHNLNNSSSVKSKENKMRFIGNGK